MKQDKIVHKNAAIHGSGLSLIPEDIRNPPNIVPRFQPIAQVDQVLTKAQRVLLRISTIFPFQFFPTVLVVDENKIDIIYTKFFFTKRIFTVFIKNVYSVTVMTSVFLRPFPLK